MWRKIPLDQLSRAHHQGMWDDDATISKNLSTQKMHCILMNISGL